MNTEQPQNRPSQDAMRRVGQKTRESWTAAQPILRAAWQKSRDAAAATIPFWRRLGLEARQAVSATLQESVRILRYFSLLWREHSLAKAARQAKHALGQRLYQHGLGEQGLRQQITAVCERIRSVEAASDARVD